MNPISLWFKTNSSVVFFVLASVGAVAVVKVVDIIGDVREDKITVVAAKIERKVQDEKERIRSHRPDRDAVIDSLRRGDM